MTRYWKFATAALVACSAPAYAGEQVLFGPPPQWVIDFDAPTGPADAADATADMPVRARMSDFQTRLEPRGVTHYIAIELEFVQPDGLSAGDISLSWQPEFDELTVHHVLIERGDEVIDVLGEGQTFTVLRREQNLDAATLTGVLTANLFPSGLEVGDVLRLAYTISSANPVLEGRPETALGPLNGIVGASRVRLSWPEDLPLTVTGDDNLPPLERDERGGWEYAALTMRMTDPLVPPAGAPARYQLVRMIEASPFADWGEVAQLFVPLYQSASQIPADGPLRTALEEIRAATDDPVIRAERALALVQDRVRYVALAMGEGGLVPADAATTWARRFGDCKAKTALLIGLLRELGIDAHPVLVSTQLGDALSGRLPMVGAFDHVIVRAVVAGQEYFLDGTRRGDTSLARITVPHFSWGLPVLAENAELVAMMPPPMEFAEEETVLRMDASAGLRAPVPVQGEVIFRGDAAVSLNSAMAQFVGQARQQALEQFWRGRYNFITPEQVEMRFDAAAGEARILLTGSAELDWDGGNYEPQNMRVGYTPDFTRAPGPSSDAPFAVPHPFHNRATHIMTLPPGFDGSEIEGERVSESAGGIEYRRELGIVGNVFTATRSTRSIAAEFTAAEAPAAAATLERLWDKRVFLNLPAAYQESAADLTAMADATLDDPQLLIDNGVALMNADQWQQAREVFDRAVELAPRNAWALANRALALAELGERDASAADAVQALALDPDNHVAFHAQGALALTGGDMAGAVAAYGRAIDAKPDNVFALRQRAQANANLRAFPEALADTRRLRELQPDFAMNYIFEGMMLAEMKDEAALTAHIDEMLARFPDEPVVRAAASEMYLRIGLDGQADTLLAQSLATAPNVIALMTSASRRSIGETDEKLAELDQAIGLAPDYVPVLLMRADTLWMEYEFDRALADVNRAIELSPETAHAYPIKFNILMDMNRRTQAVATADAMVVVSGGDAGALAQAANLYEQADRIAKARETIARAVALAPNDDFVRTVAQNIAGR